MSAARLSPQKEEVAVVRDLAPTTDISSLRSALGIFSYYRKFPTSKDEGPLPDWSRGDYNVFPSTILCFMETSIEKERDHYREIWLDDAVIQFLKTHFYAPDASAM